jgi:short-subunit dehydrogenase
MADVDFTSKSIVITGASTGIAAVSARRVAGLGAEVHVVGR